MGICSSCDVAASAVAAAPPATAKLIYPDGRLEEHPGGKVPACHALGFAAGGVGGGEDDGMVVCSADEMEFGGYVTALGECDVLQPGQIYFALPRSVLRRAMAPEDMAALAVRASTALVRSGIAVAQSHGGGERGAGGRKCKGTVQADRSWAGDVDVVQQRRRAATVAGTGGGGGGGNVNAGGNRRRKMSRGRSFSSDLIAIPE